jgi:hypothetical protein
MRAGEKHNNKERQVSWNEEGGGGGEGICQMTGSED